MAADYFVTNEGINIPSRTSDPASPEEGTFWHRSDTKKIIFFVDGNIITLPDATLPPNNKSNLDIIGKGTGGNKTTTAIIGNSLVEEFGVGDELYLHWIIPSNIDRTVDASLISGLSPTGAEAGKNVSFDITILSAKETRLIDVTTGTINIVDESIPAVDNEDFNITETLSAATFYSDVDVESLHIKVKRVASAADPVSDIAMHHCIIQYTIKQ